MYAVNEGVRRILSASSNLHNQNPYVDSIIALINKLCDMAFNKGQIMEIKMLIDIGFIIDYLEKKVTAMITLQTYVTS